MNLHLPNLTPAIIRSYLFGNETRISWQIVSRLELGEAKGDLDVYQELAAIMEEVYAIPMEWDFMPAALGRLPEEQAELRVRVLLLILATGDIFLRDRVRSLGQKALRDWSKPVRGAAARILEWIAPPTPSLVNYLFRSALSEKAVAFAPSLVHEV